jgi:dephospho-CoA kinase
MSLLVGLTGGIGSGKSAAAACFAQLGAALVDTDVIARELTVAGGAAIAPIVATFGAAVLNAEGALDRAAMRQRAFADLTVRTRLEGVLHPLIRAESERQVRRLASADFPFPYIVLVVPLLVESGGYRERVGRIAVVDCPEEMQISRVMARNGLSRVEVLAIMAAQASRAERLAAADDVIVNDAGLNKLRDQVALAHAVYLEMAKSQSLSR